MHYFHWIVGTVLAMAWFSRIVDAALGMPKVADISRPEWDRNPVSPSGNRRVSIIVPARNEEESIEQALTQLLVLDYDNYEIIAVNDRSTDRTGEIMENLAAESSARGQLRVIHHHELPKGWLGKTHAMWTATNHAAGDWLLFTDADVMFKPESLRRALAYAEAVAWHLTPDDAFWERMHRHFSEPELVELGCMIGLTLGQQSWLRLLNIEHHEVLAGTSASMAPGYEDSEKLKQSKSSRDYWAHAKAGAQAPS